MITSAATRIGGMLAGIDRILAEAGTDGTLLDNRQRRR